MTKFNPMDQRSCPLYVFCDATAFRNQTALPSSNIAAVKAWDIQAWRTTGFTPYNHAQIAATMINSKTS